MSELSTILLGSLASGVICYAVCLTLVRKLAVLLADRSRLEIKVGDLTEHVGNLDMRLENEVYQVNDLREKFDHLRGRVDCIEKYPPKEKYKIFREMKDLLNLLHDHFNTGEEPTPPMTDEDLMAMSGINEDLLGAVKKEEPFIDSEIGMNDLLH